MKKQRHIIFRSLCIMSMAGGAFGVLLAVLSMIDPELISFASRIPGYVSIKSLTMGAHVSYPYFKFVLYALSFTGALLMFLLKPRGFYFYSISQLLLLGLPYFTWNLSVTYTFFADLPDMIFTFAFIAAYAIYRPAIPVNQETLGTVK